MQSKFAKVLRGDTLYLLG